MASIFNEATLGNGWEELLVELDLEVAEVIDPRLWQALEPRVVVWLRHTARAFPWFNALALHAAIYTHTGATCAYSYLSATLFYGGPYRTTIQTWLPSTPPKRW